LRHNQGQGFTYRSINFCIRRKPEETITERMSGRGRSPIYSNREEDALIKVRGLPYETTALDLCKFFSDCKLRGGPRGIFFPLNDRKQPTGDAYIELESMRDVDIALRRHKDRMGARYIEIFEARKSALDREIRNGATNEFGFNETRRDRGGPSFGRGGGGGGFRDRSPVRRDRSPIRRDRSPFARRRSVDRGPPKSDASDFCVKLRGLPWSATKEDVVDFLSGCHILGGEDGVVFLMDEGKDRPSGDGYVEMEAEEDIAIAIKHHKQNMGSRYVEVFEANPKDVARAKDKEDNVRLRKESYMVNLRGIPYNTSEREIRDWLSEAADPSEIIIPEDRQGRPSGQANAYFKTEKEARTVVKEMHKRDMGSRYIECFYEPKD